MNKLNGWKDILLSVGLTLVMSMTATYFLFIQNTPTNDEIAFVRTELQRGIADLNVRVSLIERTQNERGPNVQDIPTLRGAVNKLQTDIAVTQRDVDGLRRNMRDFRESMIGLYNLMGKPPPPMLPRQNSPE